MSQGITTGSLTGSLKGGDARSSGYSQSNPSKKTPKKEEYSPSQPSKKPFITSTKAYAGTGASVLLFGPAAVINIIGAYKLGKKILNVVESKHLEGKRIKEFQEYKETRSHKTPINIGYDPELLASDPELLEFARNPKLQDSPEMRDAVSAEIYKEKGTLAKARDYMRNPKSLSGIQWLGGKIWGDQVDTQTYSKKMEKKSFPLMGKIEAEYFVPEGSKKERERAEDKGFGTDAGQARKGVAIENIAELGGKVLIKNMETPPENLNCTIRVPRVNESGLALPLRDASGKLIPGNFDTVVMRNGKPAMAVQGSKGECRIANMSDMMKGLKTARETGISAAVSDSKDHGTGAAAAVFDSKDPSLEPPRSRASGAAAAVSSDHLERGEEVKKGAIKKKPEIHPEHHISPPSNIPGKQKSRTRSNSI
ncbi:MAG: hypothetical protein RLN62_05460 [Rickettsiales bacterium]